MPSLVLRWTAMAGALCLWFIALDSAEAKKDDVMDLIAPSVIGSGIGNSLGKAVEAAGGMAAAASEATAAIKSARAAFWEQYPLGPNRQQAEAEFSRQLELKDLYYVLLATMNWEKKRTQQMGMGTFLDMISGKIDGGIPNRVLPEFEEWTDAVMEQFDRDKNSGKDVLRWYIDLLPSAIQAAPVQYQRYKFARDWAEFDAANREPDWTNTAHGYAIYLIYRFGGTKPEEAIDAYRAAVDIFGEEHVHTMAERIRLVSKITPRHPSYESYSQVAV